MAPSNLSVAIHGLKAHAAKPSGPNATVGGEWAHVHETVRHATAPAFPSLTDSDGSSTCSQRGPTASCVGGAKAGQHDSNHSCVLPRRVCRGLGGMLTGLVRRP